MKGWLFGVLLLAGFVCAQGTIQPYAPEPDEARSVPGAGKVWIEMGGSALDEIPPRWTSIGTTGLKAAGDEALEARTWIALEHGTQGEGGASVPLPATEFPGRMIVQVEARSPDGKWLQLRLRRPEDVLWTHNVQLGGGWRAHRVETPLPVGLPTDARLELGFSGPGEVDLSRLEVRFLDVDALSARKADPLLRGNLLRNSRLPLGLQNGWSIDRHVDDGSQLILEPENGALLARAERPVLFTSEPFRPPTGETHRASVTLEGEGRLHIRVLADGHQVSVGEEVVLTGEPRTVSVDFEPDALARFHTLSFQMEGSLHFHRFRVAAADAPVPDAPRPEVALNVASPARLLFVEDEESGQIHWRVDHAPAGSRVRFKVVNLYGEMMRLPAVDLNGRGSHNDAFALPTFPHRSLGSHRIEAWLEQDGKRISPYNELVVQRVRRPRHAEAFAPDSPFGIHVPPTRRHLAMAKGVGMNWVRLHDIGGNEWAQLEPEPGDWRFDDDAIRRYREAKFEILSLLTSSPLWANAWPEDQKFPIHSFWDKWGVPGDWDAYREYARRLTGRYREEIRVYELWNEPWIPRFFSADREPQPSGPPEYVHPDRPQETYAELSRISREAAVEVVRLIGLNSTGGESIGNRISGGEWSRGVEAAGGLEPVDMLSYHHYTTAPLGTPGDDVERGYARAVEVLTHESRAGRSVWMTEGSNSPGGMEGSFYNHTLGGIREEVDWLASADRVVRYLVSMLAAGNEKVFLYSMHAHGVFGQTQRFTTLVTPEGFLHPDAAAVAWLTWNLEGTAFVERMHDPKTLATLYRFESDDRKVRILMPAPGHPIRPEGEWRDLFGNVLRAPSEHALFSE